MRSMFAAAARLLIALPAAAQPAAPAPDGSTPPATHAPASPALIAARHAAREACMADITRLCADASAPGAHPMQCLRQHLSDVSPACTQALQAMRDARHATQG